MEDLNRKGEGRRLGVRIFRMESSEVSYKKFRCLCHKVPMFDEESSDVSYRMFGGPFLMVRKILIVGSEGPKGDAETSVNIHE